jgi:hypothetical protein
MAIDLFELVEPLRREVSPPGEDLFPNGSDEEFFGNLQDAFWEARLDGLLTNYTESDGSVVPISGTTELGRELQQLVVLYAGIRIVRNQLRALNTTFRAQAGPVEFETQKSAQLLKGLLDELIERKKFVLVQLASIGVTTTYYIDSLLAREESYTFLDTFWVR